MVRGKKGIIFSAGTFSVLLGLAIAAVPNWSEISNSPGGTTAETGNGDTTPPTITLVAPANNSTWTTSSTVDFTFRISDESGIASCTLYIKNSTDDGTYLKDRGVLANLPINADNNFARITNNGADIVVLCGAENDDPTDKVYKYNVESKIVSNMVDQPYLVDREYYAWNGSVVIGAGGWGPGLLNKIYWYDPEANHAEQKSYTLPVPMFRGPACASRDTVWLLSGQNTSGYRKDILRYNLATGTITNTGNLMPDVSYRYGLYIDMGPDDERCFILGGKNETTTVLNKVVLFNKTTETASQIATMPLGLYGVIGFLAGDYIYYGGGKHGNAADEWNTDHWFRFNVNTYAIEELTGTMDLTRASSGCVWLPDKKYAVIMAGTHGPYGYPVTPKINKVQIYNYLTKTIMNPAKDVDVSIPYTLSNGDYYWTVKCIDSEGNEGESVEWLVSVNVENEVVGRYAFYNNSFFDGSSDDDAIATDKTALLPGGTAAFANYTSYSRGINGIMVDISGLQGTPTADDFIFKIGNDNDPGSWADAPDPAGITIRVGAGVDGSDRVTIIWADNAIQKQWLGVTVKATAVTGLDVPDVFYFGNAVGDSGNSVTDTAVDTTDEIRVRLDLHKTLLNPAGIENHHDFNRDGVVNTTDEIVSRLNNTTQLDDLNLITVP